MSISKFYITALILNAVGHCYSQNEIPCRIIFLDTVLMDQPQIFTYQLNNQKKKNVSIYYDPLGQNLNNLERDESFKVIIRDNNGEMIQNKKSVPNDINVISRRVGFTESKTLTYTHDINQWVQLTKPGKYTIECSKVFEIKKRKKKIRKVIASCKTTFDLIAADSNKVAIKLDQIWFQIKNESNDFNKRTQLMKLFCKNDSPTIIPYLESVIDSSLSISDINAAIGGLSKFKDDSEVFNILSKVIEFEPERFRKFVTREELISGLMDNIQGHAIRCLFEFTDDFLVLPYLRKHYKHIQPKVRLFIMQELDRRQDSLAKTIIETNLQDEEERIRSQAQSLLKKY